MKLLILFNILLLVFCNSPKNPEDKVALALLIAEGNPNPVKVAETTPSLDKVTTVLESSGVFRTTVNASSTKTWILVNLKDSGKQVESDAWDMRFKRFVIGTNSGSSGTKQAGACDTGLLDFAIVTVSTSCKDGGTFLVDSLQSQTGGGGGAGDVSEPANPALFSWYEYNNTVLTAKKNVYLVRGADGTSVFKLQMTDYYSQAGSSGYPTFRWSKLR
jgi:hypothetical protein